MRRTRYLVFFGSWFEPISSAMAVEFRGFRKIWKSGSIGRTFLMTRGGQRFQNSIFVFCCLAMISIKEI